MPKRQSLKLDFANIVEESLNEIYIFDAKTLNFIFVNQGARLNSGYSMDELLVMTPVDLKPEHDVESFKKIIQPCLDNILQKNSIRYRTSAQRWQPI